MIAGIDIGGTKTHLVAQTGKGERRERLLETSSWRFRRDQEVDASSLADLVLDLAGQQPRATVVGAHGCDTDADCLTLQSLLAGHLSGTVLVLNDSELLLPAAARSSGIAVIAGTGSIAVSRGVDRKMLSAGGWGWFLGDEGSASGLVRDAARAVRRSLDEGHAMDPLGYLLSSALGVASPVEFGRALGDLGSAARIGSLAHLVFEAAHAGSLMASQIIADGGDALALLVERLVSRGAAGVDVVSAGGVISAQRSLFLAFETALRRRVPKARLSLLTAAPVTGALLIAADLAEGMRPKTLPYPHVDGVLDKDKNGKAA